VADDFVQVAPDGTGKKIRNLLLTVGANNVEQQVVTLAKSDGTLDPILAVPAASLPLPAGASTETTLGAVLKEGTDITGASMPAGGASGRGWLSAIWKLLSGGLPAALAASGGLKVDIAGTGANATAVKVDGSGVTQPVSAAGLTNLDVALSTRTKPADQQHVIVDTMTPALALDASVSALLKPASTLAAVTAVTAITNALPAGTNKLGTVDIATAAATAKGTQGANAVPVQELKDSGRVNIMWTLEFAPAAVAEALMTMTESRDGAAVTTFTTKVVTSGKRLRITSWTMTTENTLGVNPKRAKLRMKYNTAGAVTTASPLQANLVASVPGVVNTVGAPAMDDFPDGIEFLGDGTKQIGFTLEFPDWVTGTQTGKVYVTIFGFEY
jgi:hypothetical protein